MFMIRCFEIEIKLCGGIMVNKCNINSFRNSIIYSKQRFYIFAVAVAAAPLYFRSCSGSGSATMTSCMQRQHRCILELRCPSLRRCVFQFIAELKYVVELNKQGCTCVGNLTISQCILCGLGAVLGVYRSALSISGYEKQVLCIVHILWFKVQSMLFP